MQAKQKVTLYLSPELHRRLKIRAAIDAEPMSELAERAIVFYLAHPELVDAGEAYYGRTHQVYDCPKCEVSVVIKGGEMVPLSSQAVAIKEQLPVEHVLQSEDQEGQGQLVPC